MKCPRQVESHICRDSEYNPLYDPHDDACRHCGSLNPDTFMARLEAGDVELSPTDKSYKVYVRNQGGAQFKQRYRVDDLPFEGHDSPNHEWVVRNRDETKFYFQHLSAEQQARFLALLNEKKLKMGVPGYFYVAPFFIRFDEPAPASV